MVGIRHQNCRARAPVAARRGVTRLSPGVVVIGDVRLSTYTSAPVRGSSPWPSVGRMVRALDPRAAAGVLGGGSSQAPCSTARSARRGPTGYEAMNNREALKVLVRPHRPRCRSHWRKHEHHVGTDGRAAAGRRHRPQARRAHRRRPVRGHLGAPELARRDRSRSPSPLVTNGSTEQLVGHLRIARQNGLTETELVEAIVHLAFYAGWPRAMSAIAVAKEVFAEDRKGGRT